jgi:GNAT superfamily N-acetyltransferase
MMWGLLSNNLTARRFYASIGEESHDRIATWVGGDAFRSLAALALPPGSLVLRNALPVDSAVLARFLRAMWREFGLPLPIGTAGHLLSDGFGARPAFTALIAERAGEPIGHALFWPTYDTEGSRRRGGWLSDLYVVPHARRGGVAMQLMAEVARRTAGRGGSYLRWLVQANNAPARAFYARFALEWHKGFVCLCAGDRFDALAESAPPLPCPDAK